MNNSMKLPKKMPNGFGDTYKEMKWPNEDST